MTYVLEMGSETDHVKSSSTNHLNNPNSFNIWVLKIESIECIPKELMFVVDFGTKLAIIFNDEH